jgi:hypothetical protein
MYELTISTEMLGIMKRVASTIMYLCDLGIRRYTLYSAVDRAHSPIWQSMIVIYEL